MDSLNIALDFDGTFDRDPCLWGNFIGDARAAGHTVIIVTARKAEDRSDIHEFLFRHDIQIPVFCTAHGSKLDFVKRHGIRIDIWIDDDPETLVRGH